jgi:hypothetical protein
MRLYQTGAPLTGARSQLIPHPGVLVDGTRIVAVVTEAHRLGKRVAEPAAARAALQAGVLAAPAGPSPR